jgi:hypothetical protein
MISRISGAAYLTETHGSSIRLIRIRDYASDHVELHSFVCTPGHATRTLRGSEDMAFGFRVCSSQAASAPETRGGAVGPSFTPRAPGASHQRRELLDHPSRLLDHPSQLLDHPSQLLDHPSRQAGSHLALGGTGSTQDLRVAAHAPTRSVSAPPAPVGKAWRRGEHLHASDHV